MDIKKEHIDNLIVQLFCDGLTDAEIAELKAWIDLSPDNKRYFLEQQEIWFSATTAEQLARYDKDEAFETFCERIRKSKKQHSLSLRHIWKYAAAIVLFLVIAVGSYWYGQKDIASQLAEIEVTAPEGSRTRTQLPDGTVVWLNAGSHLVYSQAFGLKERSVRLNGEGYFEVTKNPEKPFHVESSSIKVNVLGTKFNFRDYEEDKEAEVMLTEGSVELQNLIKTSAPNQIKPGQRASLNKITGKMTITNDDSSVATSWTGGQLTLNGETLPMVAKKIERYFGVNVTIDDARLYNLRFYGEFIRQNQSLDDVLGALSKTGKIRYKIEKGNVVIY